MNNPRRELLASYLSCLGFERGLAEEISEKVSRQTLEMLSSGEGLIGDGVLNSYSLKWLREEHGKDSELLCLYFGLYNGKWNCYPTLHHAVSVSERQEIKDSAASGSERLGPKEREEEECGVFHYLTELLRRTTSFIIVKEQNIWAVFCSFPIYSRHKTAQLSKSLNIEEKQVKT